MTCLKKILLALLVISFTGIATGQENHVLSLEDAKNMAIEQNKQVKNAQKDVDIARMTVTETRAIGLPQVEASGSLSNNLQVATQLIPSEFFGGLPGTYTPVQFGTQYNASIGIQASQILFSGPYFVALKTSRIYKQLAEDQLNKTELDVKENVANTYAIILATQQYIQFMQTSIENLENNLNETRKMVEAGMAESTDADRLSITLSTLNANKKSLENSLQASYSMLRHQLGLAPESKIELSASMDDLVRGISIKELLETAFNIENNADYKILQTREELNKKAWQRERMEYLPTLSVFYQYSESSMGQELTFEDRYPSEIIGLQVTVPLFNSGTKYAKSTQARLEYEKTINTKQHTQELLEINKLQYRDNLSIAFKNYQTQKENVALSDKLYKQMEIKYNNGTISSFELTQTYDQYVDAQNRLFQSLLELVQAGIELQKLHGNL